MKNHPNRPYKYGIKGYERAIIQNSKFKIQNLHQFATL